MPLLRTEEARSSTREIFSRTARRHNQPARTHVVPGRVTDSLADPDSCPTDTARLFYRYVRPVNADLAAGGLHGLVRGGLGQLLRRRPGRSEGCRPPPTRTWHGRNPACAEGGQRAHSARGCLDKTPQPSSAAKLRNEIWQDGRQDDLRQDQRVQCDWRRVQGDDQCPWNCAERHDRNRQPAADHGDDRPQGPLEEAPARPSGVGIPRPKAPRTFG